jgi:hypothetical protein
MSQKIKCPKCDVEFNMEEGLSSHLKTIENNTREQIQKEQGDKIKENSEKVKLLTSENEEKKLQIQKINLEKDNEKKAAVKIAIDATKKDSDKDNKAHYESLYEAKFQERTENLNEMNSEKQKLWGLKEKRLIETIEDLQKKATQGTTVDQGSSAEMQLGEFLKKIFKNKKDNINEYAKGVPGGDWLQEIIENDIPICKILYERKNTKSWSNDWLKKLQEDMKDSGSDIGIIFTRATPKEFPKDEPFIHKGNIFICRYDFIALKSLASTQRYLLTQLNKERISGKDNVLSAIKFWENPKVKNITFQLINNLSKQNKKLLLTKKNLDDVINLNDSMDTNFEELFSEIDLIGISSFLEKKNDTGNNGG